MARYKNTLKIFSLECSCAGFLSFKIHSSKLFLLLICLILKFFTALTYVTLWMSNLEYILIS